MMRSQRWLALALICAAGTAHAHTHLKESVPAQNSTVKTPPEQIALTFSAPARLTALAIQKEGGTEQKLTPLPSDAAARVTVPTPKLAPGKYTVSWRVVSGDNHVMSGKLRFTVAGAAAGS